MKTLNLIPLVLLSACASQPTPPDAGLTTLQKHLAEAKAGDFGAFMSNLHQAEDQLDRAETLYQQLQTGNSNAQLRQQGEQAAKSAVAHRASAEQALGRILNPLATGMESNVRNQENLDDRLAYLEDLHIPEGMTIPEEAVYFNFGSARLLSKQQDKLQEIIEFLQQYPVFAMQLVGYADTVGGQAYNRRLAERRNQAVLNLLRKHGLPPQTLVTIAVGEAAGPDEMRNPDNRRVEVRPYVHGRYAERIAVNTDQETREAEPDFSTQPAK